MLSSRHWWPPPRVVSPDAATSRWDTSRCASCRRFCSRLIACRYVPLGGEVTVAAHNLLDAASDALHPYEVTLDGGVREVRGHRVAGAGAVLWGIEPSTGIAALMAEALVALPGVRCSQTAEAWGARAALDLLRQTSATRRCARVCGDNLAVVRFGAAHGRLRRPEVQCILELAIATMCTVGWLLDWHAVRRRLNMAADTAATSALFWAARLADDGVQQQRVRVTWRHTSHITPP